MCVTINLFDHLLETGRRYHEAGQYRAALVALTRLSACREISPEIAEETQVRLGELYLKRRKFVRARRHLTAALRHGPEEARYHYLMGLACQEEDRGDLYRAARHYRRALRLDAHYVDCLVTYGQLAIRLGRSEVGLAKLRAAGTLAPNDPQVTARLVKVLRHAGKPDEARTAARTALFLNPRDPRFRRLWNEYQFRELRRQQQAAHTEVDPRTADDLVLLPFVRLATQESTPQVRRDGPAAVTVPHRLAFQRKKDQREVK